MRKFFQKTLAILAITIFSCSLCGCFTENAKLQNVQTYDLSTVTYISLEYYSDNVTVYESESDELVVKEYFNEDDSDCYAAITSNENAIDVKSGVRPDDPSFRSYIEVYIPQSYHGDLVIETGSGMIKIKPAYTLDTLSLQTNSGAISLDSIEATSISATSQSGSIKMTTCTGQVFAQTTTSTITVDDLAGYGTFESQSGGITLSLNEVEGNIKARTTTGKVQLKLPENAEYLFEAESKSGYITVPFDSEDLDADNTKQRVYASIGTRPTENVLIDTTSGAISVSLT